MVSAATKDSVVGRVTSLVGMDAGSSTIQASSHKNLSLAWSLVYNKNDEILMTECTLEDIIILIAVTNRVYIINRGENIYYHQLICNQWSDVEVTQK